MTHFGLDQFFGAYFHQDWSFDDSRWEGVVARFRRDVGREGCAAAAAELRDLLDQEASDDRLDTIVYRDCGCFFDPRPDLGGPTLREWLRQVASELEAA